MHESSARPPDNPEESRLWEEYWRTSTDRARNELFEFYAEHLRIVSRSLYRRYAGSEVSFDDVWQYAALGLLEAIERFSASGGAGFRTFSSYRMRGAVLSGLEKHSERLDQLSRGRKVQRERVRSAMSAARKDGGDLMDQLLDVTLDVAFARIIDIEQMRSAEHPVTCGPYDDPDTFLLLQHLDSLVGELPEAERQVVSLHYLKDHAFQHIAQVMGVSRSRVSQLHGSALRLMRDAFARKRKLDITL